MVFLIPYLVILLANIGLLAMNAKVYFVILEIREELWELYGGLKK